MVIVVPFINSLINPKLLKASKLAQKICLGVFGVTSFFFIHPGRADAVIVDYAGSSWDVRFTNQALTYEQLTAQTLPAGFSSTFTIGNAAGLSALIAAGQGLPNSAANLAPGSASLPVAPSTPGTTGAALFFTNESTQAVVPGTTLNSTQGIYYTNGSAVNFISNRAGSTGLLATVPSNFHIWAYAQNRGSSQPSSSVPGPLPLMGAGVAFGLSRQLRKRIRSGDSSLVSHE